MYIAINIHSCRLLHLAIVHKKVDLIRATILAMEKRKQEDTKTRGVNIQNKLRQVNIILLILHEKVVTFKNY